MPKIDPNDSRYDGGGTLPDGDHIVFISDIEVGESKNKGTPYVRFAFECHDPESPHNESKLRFQDYYITDGATWRFVQLCRAARPDGCPPVDTDDEKDVSRELLDRPLVITVTSFEDTYNGKTRTKYGITAHRSLSASEEAKLRAAYNGFLVPPMEGGATPPGGDGTFSDDEIPF